MKLLTVISNVILLAASMSPQAMAVPEAGKRAVVRCIAIDPGHGGKDPGAVGNGLQEKAINLGVALKLGRMIEEQLPGVRVVYTRRDDRFLSLADRSKAAAEAGADLFVSIHTNSSTSASAAGTETFVMGEDKDNRNLSVVMRENAVISLEPDYTSRYEGYDPNSSESLILFSLMQYVYQSQSLSLAERIQEQYATYAGRRDKGVKQAGFLVLWRTPMPSVLTEVGFISNPTEARFLGSAAGQEKVAASIFRAIREYKRLTDSRATALTGSSNRASAAGATVKTAAASKPAAESTPKAAPSFTPSSAPKPTPKPTLKPAPKPAQGAVSGATQATKRTVFVTPPATRTLHEEPGDGKTLFRIQVRSTLVRVPLTRSNFGDYAAETLEMRIDGRYKYFCGTSFSYREALLLQRKVRHTFPDAFMVAFREGRPVPLAEALSGR